MCQTYFLFLTWTAAHHPPRPTGARGQSACQGKGTLSTFTLTGTLKLPVLHQSPPRWQSFPVQIDTQNAEKWQSELTAGQPHSVTSFATAPPTTGSSSPELHFVSSESKHTPPQTISAWLHISFQTPLFLLSEGEVNKLRTLKQYFKGRQCNS